MKYWICALVVLSHSGCAALPNIPTHQLTARPAIVTGGGTFGATYHGSYSIAPCVQNRSTGSLSIRGSGRGNFIHKSTEHGTLIADSADCVWAGDITLSALGAHPQDTIMMSVTFNGGGRAGNPCNPVHGQVQFVVSGGTGRFKNAAGNGTIKLTCNSNGTYFDHWSGTIIF